MDDPLKITSRLVRDHGWRVVLLSERSKRPAGDKWQITTSVSDVERHVKEGGNIGLICGPGLVAVLDFDDLIAAREMFRELGALAITVRTGSGKWHCYIKHEANLPAKIVWKGKVVGEVQRGPNQQVVMPPSVHPNSGKHYLWETVPEELPQLPVRWRERLTAQAQPAAAQRKTITRKRPTQEEYDAEAVKIERAKRKARDQVDKEQLAPELVVYKASEVARTRPRKLFGGRLVQGVFQLMVGPGEAGKGMVSMDIIARFSTGEPFPGEEKGREPITVMTCVTEDSKEVVSSRLEAAGANLEHVHFVEGPPALRGGLVVPSPVAFDNDAGALVELAKKMKVGALFLETTVEHLGDREGRHQVHTNNEYDVRKALSPIIALCREAKLVGWGVMHPRKSMDGGIEDSISGSAGFRNAGRGVLHVYRDPEDEEPTPWRLLVASKANYLPRRPQTLKFHIYPWEKDPEEGRVIWGIAGRTLEDPRSAEEIWVQMQEARSQRRRKDYTVMEAEKFLEETLASGMRSFEEIKELSREMNFSWRAIERAKAKLQVKSIRAGSPSRVIGWGLPDQEDM